VTAPGSPAGAEAAVEAEVTRALTRAAIYRLLGRAFGYPTPAVVAELAGLAETAGWSPACPAALRAPLGELAAVARAADPVALADEHVFLFDRQVPCPPYEGAYGPADPMAAGKAAALADVEGFYAAFGLAPSAERPDAADHVGAELEFMSALALKEGYALAAGEPEEHLAVTRAAQARFVTDHLGRWAEAFAETLREASTLPFHRAAADLLGGWVADEIRTLGVSPVPLGPPAARGSVEGDVLACPMGEAPAGPPAAPGAESADP
jgi:TorA maturation chaperone TorD